MNGAEPDEVYMGNLASNVRMLLDTYDQFTDGLAPLLSAFLTRYEVRLDTATEGLLVDAGRVTGVRVGYPDGQTGELHGAGVIVATPANVAATLTEPILPDLARELRSIAYYPVTLVIAEYDRPIFSPTARAFVFDGHEAVSNAGADAADAETLLEIGEAALARYTPVHGGWRRRFVARRFSPGLCAYAPHHGGLIDRVNQELKAVAGLHLTGDYVQGASIEACFRSASACARQLAGEPQAADRGRNKLYALYV